MASHTGRRWLLRVVIFASFLLSLFAIAGFSYQLIASHADVQRFPRPGHLVNAGGVRLNLYCTGLGNPTVVLDAGLADSLDSWRRVQPEIARFTRVCSYDRAGYGYSDPGPMPRTSERIAGELHVALRSAGEKPPYLLVGHSFGGFNVRVFSGKYSDEVFGLILVDATQEDQYRPLPRTWAEIGAATRRRARRQAFWAPLYIDLGLARLQFGLQGYEVPSVLLQAKYIKARTSELENIEVSAEQARRAGSVDYKPLVVLTGGMVIDAGLKAALSEEDQRAFADIWVNTLQLRLAQLSKRGRRIVLPDSGHDIPTGRPDAIVAAVRDVGTPLNQH